MHVEVSIRKVQLKVFNRANYNPKESGEDRRCPKQKNFDNEGSQS